MKDIAARELKGHNILAVERFWDSTFWMIEFTVLRPTAYGEPGDEMRLFLTEDGYQSALQSQQRREIKIKRYAHVIEGHILDFKWIKKKELPTHYALESVPELGLKSVVLLEQIKTIDKRRVLSYIGRVSREEMRAIDDALQVSLDIHIPEEMEAP